MLKPKVTYSQSVLHRMLYKVCHCTSPPTVSALTPTSASAEYQLPIITKLSQASDQCAVPIRFAMVARRPSISICGRFILTWRSDDCACGSSARCRPATNQAARWPCSYRTLVKHNQTLPLAAFCRIILNMTRLNGRVDYIFSKISVLTLERS